MAYGILLSAFTMLPSTPDRDHAACAVSWTLYGLIASQLGDVHDDFITQEDGTRTPVADYIYQCAASFC